MPRMDFFTPSKGAERLAEHAVVIWGLHFQLYPLRFSFVARESIHFPPGKSGNILRGAVGTIFRKIACLPHCPGSRECEIRASCAYARMFEPSALSPGPSGLADWPRPFVFRATHLDGSTVPPGAPFHFDLNLFDTRFDLTTVAQHCGAGTRACRVDTPVDAF